MINDDALGFTKASVVVDGRHRQVVRFVCVDCSATTDVTVKSGETLNIEALAATARGRGWDADPLRKSRCRCPRHLKQHTPTDTDTELRKFEAKQMIAKQLTVPAIVPLTRDPTADQRAMIRKLLEEHFDEDRGCYLDGYDDEKIAEEAKTPRIVVERLRDTAYGSIRVSAEMLELEREISALKKALADHLRAAKELHDQLELDAAALRKRVTAIEDRAAKISSARAA